jgi:hypothetical protein
LDDEFVFGSRHNGSNAVLKRAINYMDSTPSTLLSNDCEKKVMVALERKDYSTAKEILIAALKTGQLRTGIIDLVQALTTLYCLERHYDEAELLYTSLLAANEKKWGTNHPDVVDTLKKLAVIVRAKQSDSILAKIMAFRAQSLAVQSKA